MIRVGRAGDNRVSTRLALAKLSICALVAAVLLCTHPATAMAESTAPKLSRTPFSSTVVRSQNECDAGTVQLSPATPSSLELLQSAQAWTRSTGVSIIVAVVDSGVDTKNPHLVDAVIGGTNLVNDGENASGLTDIDGHGTAIAGQIAARQITGSGVIGLANGAKILSVRVFRGTDDESVKAGFGPSVERLAQGIRYSTDHGATIINASLSDYADNAALRDAISYATARGSLVVASAGNRATSADKTDGVRFPAGYPGVLSVTATTTGGSATDDSIHGPHIGVAAPGSDILTTATNAGDCLYASAAPSSSFATGYASAAAALVAAAHPSETPLEWIYRLEATALRANPDVRDDLTGWGIVQPYSAIVLTPSASTRGPANPDRRNEQSVVATKKVAVDAAHNVTTGGNIHSWLLGLAVISATILCGLSLIPRLRRRA